MKLEERLYYYGNGKMNLFTKFRKTYNIANVYKPLKIWYKKHPYAKRLDDGWICSDYRIDQQRPQRRVFSEGYIKFVEITEIEEKVVDKIISELESKIDYPCVWDDGEHSYYEEKIICPNCHKERKVLTSETECEFCGFKFDEAFKCSECGALNLKGSDECINCHTKFNKKSFINNEEVEIIKNKENKSVKCPVCNTRKSKYFDECQNCGFTYHDKKQCPICHKWIKKGDNFCQYCGTKQKVYIKCKNCGKEMDNEKNYCTKCGVKL